MTRSRSTLHRYSLGAVRTDRGSAHGTCRTASHADACVTSTGLSHADAVGQRGLLLHIGSLLELSLVIRYQSAAAGIFVVFAVSQYPGLFSNCVLFTLRGLRFDRTLRVPLPSDEFSEDDGRCFKVLISGGACTTSIRPTISPRFHDGFLFLSWCTWTTTSVRAPWHRAVDPTGRGGCRNQLVHSLAADAMNFKNRLPGGRRSIRSQ